MEFVSVCIVYPGIFGVSGIFCRYSSSLCLKVFTMHRVRPRMFAGIPLKSWGPLIWKLPSLIVLIVTRRFIWGILQRRPWLYLFVVGDLSYTHTHVVNMLYLYVYVCIKKKVCMFRLSAVWLYMLYLYVYVCMFRLSAVWLSWRVSVERKWDGKMAVRHSNTKCLPWSEIFYSCQPSWLMQVIILIMQICPISY